jgi:hypothetical protein
MRGFPQRVLLGLGGLVAIVAVLGGCPKPGPSPVVNPPDASDAAPAVSCVTACANVSAVCPASANACAGICARVAPVDPGYAGCLAAARGCPDLKCDAVARAAKAAPSNR